MGQGLRHADLPDAALKAGVCQDPDEEAARSAIRRWLRQWKTDGTMREASRATPGRDCVGKKAGVLGEEERKRKGTSRAIIFQLQQEGEDSWVGPSESPVNPEGAFEKSEKSVKKARSKRNASPRNGGPVEELVKPRVLGRAKDHHVFQGPPLLGGGNYSEHLEALKLEALMQNKLSEGMRAGYETGWKQWILYRRM